MTPARSTAELVDRGDLDELLRRIDDLCDAGDWQGLLDLRDRCRGAFERGRQLWPAASHAEYRLALQAPGRWAAPVVLPGAGHFALGPLSEVTASTHAWADLAPHLPRTPEVALVAHERVLRGEDLSGDPDVDVDVLELPLRLQGWEPAYPLAVYRPYTAEFPSVAEPPMEVVDLPSGDAPDGVHDPDATFALRELAAVWATQSNGSVAVAAVRGDVTHAIAALTGGGPVRLGPLDVADAVAVMGWAAASGGAHGRRRGMAHGRFAAWWAVAALAGELERWPAIGPAVDKLRWYRWDRGQPSTGWALRVAAERPDGRAWAVEATDEA